MKNFLIEKFDNLYNIVKNNIVQIVIIYSLFTLYCLNADLLGFSDNYFLYNRFKQICDCIKDGIYPYFYYNDFGGVGYGSSFFYGQLTLFPFVILSNFKAETFLCVYYLTSLLLTYFGVCSLARHYSNNYKFISTIFIVSCIYTSFGLPVNKFAFGLSCFFLSYCIDFFKDNKNYYKASILFFLIINTHTITALFSFTLCLVIFIYYFNRKCVVEYLKFALSTLLLCLYNIANIVYHYNSVNLNNNIEVIKNSLSDNTTLSGNIFPFSSYIIRVYVLKKLFDNNILSGISIIILPVLSLSLFSLYKRKTHLTIIEKSIIIIFFIGSIINIKYVWYYIYQYINFVFQYSARFMLYLLLFYFIVCFRDYIPKRSNIIIFICMLDIFLGGATMLSSTEPVQDNNLLQINNGEYLSENFIWDRKFFDYTRSHVTNDRGQSIVYRVEKNKVIINIPKHSDNWIVRVPKLYYKGYHSNFGKCYEGKGQFVEVDIGKQSGILYVYYKQPYMLICLQILSIIIMCFMINKILLSIRKNI